MVAYVKLVVDSVLIELSCELIGNSLRPFLEPFCRFLEFRHEKTGSDYCLLLGKPDIACIVICKVLAD